MYVTWSITHFYFIFIFLAKTENGQLLTACYNCEIHSGHSLLLTVVKGRQRVNDSRAYRDRRDDNCCVCRMCWAAVTSKRLPTCHNRWNMLMNRPGIMFMFWAKRTGFHCRRVSGHSRNKSQCAGLQQFCWFVPKMIYFVSAGTRSRKSIVGVCVLRMFACGTYDTLLFL